jgi:ribokinase
LNKEFDAVTVGYTATDYLGIIPHFPEEDLKLELERFEVQGGGPAATAAVTMSRLGLRTAFIGKTGDDDLGIFMRHELEKEDIDISAMKIEEGATSQFAFIMVDRESAARTILWTRGTLSPLQPTELDLDLISSCRGLLIDTLEVEAAAEAARIAREAGVRVVIDAGTLRDGVTDILPFCDFIVASETFARQIGEDRGVKHALERMMEYGPEAAVVTLGAKGCVSLSSDGLIESKGFEVEAVDTTGAGDVFHGAFLYAVLNGWDIRRCCVFSNAVAAMKCRKLGGRQGIPDINEVNEFLSKISPNLDFGQAL